MFRMSNRNRKKSSKVNSSKTSSKKTDYVEEVNEVILNDLVPEERRNEFGMDEVQQQATKKKSGLSLNLGLNSKKKPTKNTSADSKASKGKNKGASSESSKGTHGESYHADKNQASEISKHSAKSKQSVDQESLNAAGKSSGKSSSKSSKKEKTSSKGGKTSNKKGKNTGSNKSSKPSPKKKGSAKSHSGANEDNVESTKHVDEKTTQKAGSKKSSGMKKKRVNSEDISIKQMPEIEIEEYVPVDFDIEEIGKSFRSEERIDQEYEIIEENHMQNKFENLVWSEDKFPKK